MIRIFTRQMEKLGSEEGQALVYVAMVGVVIFLFFAMTMNLGAMIDAKIKAQNVADAAALSAAVWQARVMNLLAASNQVILLNWMGSLTLMGTSILTGPLCAFQCLTAADWLWNPLCFGCIIVNIGILAASFWLLASAALATDFQRHLLNAVDRDFVEADVWAIVELNYAHKALTDSLPVDGFVHLSSNSGEAIFDDRVIAKANLCQTFHGILLSTYDFLPQSQQNSILLNIDRLWSTSDSLCSRADTHFPLPSGFQYWTPYQLQPWTRGKLEPVVAGVYREVQRPPILPFGQNPSNCSPAGAVNENTFSVGTINPTGSHTVDVNKFVCPNQMHYAFAGAQAFSRTVDAFFSTDPPGTFPYTFYRSDWQARLAPIEQRPDDPSGLGGWRAMDALSDRIEFEVGRAGTSDFIMSNILSHNQGVGTTFFLY